MENKKKNSILSYYLTKHLFRIEENITNCHLHFYGLNKELKSEEELDVLYPIDSSNFKELTTEVYCFLESMIEDEGTCYFDKAEISTNLFGLIEKEEKEVFLKSALKDFWSIEKERTVLFLSYMEKLNDKETWMESTLDLFIQTPQILIYYLNGNLKEYVGSKEIASEGIDDFMLEWIQFFKKKCLINFCEEKIFELKSKKHTTNNFTTIQKVLLLEKILSDNNWQDRSATSKSKIVAMLIDRNPDNIKKIITDLDKKPTDPKRKKSSQIESDNLLIEELFKKTLG